MTWPESDPVPVRTAVVVVGLGLITLVGLAGCTTAGSTAVAVSPLPTVLVHPAVASPVTPLDLSTLSFCVGTSASHPADRPVRIHFMRGRTQLAAPVMEVPMRTAIAVSAGRFQVVVDGLTKISGGDGGGGARRVRVTGTLLSSSGWSGAVRWLPECQFCSVTH